MKRLTYLLLAIFTCVTMATISSTTHRADYVGNSAAHVYAYPYRIFSNTDLVVTVRNASNVETTLALTTDYTVTGVSNRAGGNVTLVDNGQAWLTGTELTDGFHLTISRVRPLLQTTDIKNQGAFYPESHENSFDHFIMIDQQQQDQIDRSIKLPPTVDPSVFNSELPVIGADDADKLLGVNDSASGWQLVDPADLTGATGPAGPQGTPGTNDGGVTRIDSGVHKGTWILSNAEWTGTVFNRIDVNQSAFAIKMSIDNLQAPELNTEANGTQTLFAYSGDNPIDDTYGTIGGWNVMSYQGAGGFANLNSERFILNYSGNHQTTLNDGFMLVNDFYGPGADWNSPTWAVGSNILNDYFDVYRSPPANDGGPVVHLMTMFPNYTNYEKPLSVTAGIRVTQNGYSESDGFTKLAAQRNGGVLYNGIFKSVGRQEQFDYTVDANYFQMNCSNGACWYSGFKDDSFVVQRAPTTATTMDDFVTYMNIDSTGAVTFPESAAAGSSEVTTVLDSTDTFAVPTGVTTIHVTMCGGGGPGGGGGGFSTHGGSGGGGGAGAIIFDGSVAVVAEDTLTGTIGTGGVGGAAGGGIGVNGVATTLTGTGVNLVAPGGAAGGGGGLAGTTTGADNGLDHDAGVGAYGVAFSGGGGGAGLGKGGNGGAPGFAGAAGKYYAGGGGGASDPGGSGSGLIGGAGGKSQWLATAPAAGAGHATTNGGGGGGGGGSSYGAGGAGAAGANSPSAGTSASANTCAGGGGGGGKSTSGNGSAGGDGGSGKIIIRYTAGS